MDHEKDTKWKLKAQKVKNEPAYHRTMYANRPGVTLTSAIYWLVAAIIRV